VRVLRLPQVAVLMQVLLREGQAAVRTMSGRDWLTDPSEIRRRKISKASYDKRGAN
jgi:hypothetical protein